MKFDPIKRNRQRRAVLVQVIGEEANRIHNITRDAQKAYADKIGADYKVLRPKLSPVPYSKMCALHYTRYYDQSLILDVDVVPTQLASNIFDLVPLGEWGVVDEAHMRPREFWHNHQQDLNLVLERKGIDPVYLSRLANTGVIVAPHNGEAIYYNEEREPCQNNPEEKAWFTYNLERTYQKVNWLHELWNVCATDPEFNKKYPYANFIHRNEQNHKARTLKSDIIQHIGEVRIPDFIPGEYAIVTIDFSHDPFYSCVRESIVQYAKRCGAQLIEIKGTYSQGMHHCWPKYYAAQVAKHFKKTLYLDTDVYIDENAPSIFEATPDDQWCFVDESGLVGNQTLTIAYDQCLANHDIVRRGRWQIYNAGIMVIPTHGIDIYHHHKPWKLDQFWDEQTMLNYSIVGQEFHVMDTSWDTMPFTRSNDPIKFFHVAGGGKFQNLSQYLDYEFNRVLFYWPSNSIFAERLSRFLDKQLCNGIMLGHYNWDQKEIVEERKKYITIVEDPVDFMPHLVYYIDTPVQKKMLNRPGIYIITAQDFVSEDAIKNVKMWSRLCTVIATNNHIIKLANKYDITINQKPFKFNIPTPGRDGHAYTDIDDDCFLVGMVYSPSDTYIKAVEKIMNEDGFRVVTIDDYTKTVPCNYRLNNLRNSGNLISRMDAVIDITDQNPYNTLLLEAVLARKPVSAPGMDLGIYMTPEINILDTVYKLRDLHIDHLTNRRDQLLEYLDYNKCWELWKSLMINTELPHEPELTV